MRENALMLRQLHPALLLLLVMTLFSGLAYPLLVAGLTQAVIAMQTNDGPMIDDCRELFSPELIDEPLGAPEYFWGRSSTGGLDSQINPGAAHSQAARIARARNISEWQVRRLIAQSVEFRKVGMLGEPCVNVPRLNLALDAISPKVQSGR
jgi:potassium-transporting ATPase KdpC subunit